MNTTAHMFDTTQEKTWPVERIFLSCRQVFRILSHDKALRIQVTKGTLHITMSEDPKDYILRSGEEMVVRARGLVLLQGLPEGSFQYTLY